MPPADKISDTSTQLIGRANLRRVITKKVLTQRTSMDFVI